MNFQEKIGLLLVLSGLFIVNNPDKSNLFIFGLALLMIGVAVFLYEKKTQ